MKYTWILLCIAACGDDGPAPQRDAPPDLIDAPRDAPPADATDAAVVCLDAGVAPCNATTFPNACQAVDGARFRSVEPRECGNCGNDAGSCCPCQWTIEFTSNSFEWQHSGAETGMYTCSGFMLTGMRGPTRYDGSYDNACGLLTWDGVVYERF